MVLDALVVHRDGRCRQRRRTKSSLGLSAAAATAAPASAALSEDHVSLHTCPLSHLTRQKGFSVKKWNGFTCSRSSFKIEMLRAKYGMHATDDLDRKIDPISSRNLDNDVI